jgi:hypothetical protein
MAPMQLCVTGHKSHKINEYTDSLEFEIFLSLHALLENDNRKIILFCSCHADCKS